MSRKAKIPPRRQLRVLIADDTAVIRDSMSNLVARLKDVEIVGVARTGLEALEKIRELKPDIATLDIRMPELNGMNVLKAIKEEQLGTKVIVLTGLVEAEYKKNCMALGAEFFFNKANEFEMVVEILKQRAAQLNAQP